eukprot:scaffold55515_cov26-Tisochrysis_lutea.AAC.5
MSPPARRSSVLVLNARSAMSSARHALCSPTPDRGSTTSDASSHACAPRGRICPKPATSPLGLSHAMRKCSGCSPIGFIFSRMRRERMRGASLD